MRDARRFAMDELSAATKNFSDKSLIGQGKFGEVYKGLLHDGILVAIKKRPAPPTHEFIEEVSHFLTNLILICILVRCLWEVKCCLLSLHCFLLACAISPCSCFFTSDGFNDMNMYTVLVSTLLKRS